MGVYLRGKSWYIDFYYEGRRYTEGIGLNQKLTYFFESGKKVFKSETIFCVGNY